MSKIPMVDDSIPDQLQCTNCLLPMQYQEKKMENFFGNVLNVEKKFLYLKTLMMIWKKLGVLLDNEFL
jgi:hypothetical protein